MTHEVMQVSPLPLAMLKALQEEGFVLHDHSHILDPAALAQNKPTTLKAVIQHRNGESYKKWLWLQEQVKSRSQGRLEIEITTIGELGLGGTEMLLMRFFWKKSASAADAACWPHTPTGSSGLWARSSLVVVAMASRTVLSNVTNGS